MPNQVIRLYDLDTDLAFLEDQLLEAGGEITDDIAADLDELLDARDDKIESYIAVIRDFEASAEAVAAEEKRLKARRTALQNAGKNMKRRLQASMEARGESEHRTRLGKVYLQRNPPSITVLCDVDELPDELVRVTKAPDMRAIKDALAEGQADLTQIAEQAPATYHLRIR